MGQLPNSCLYYGNSRKSKYRYCIVLIAYTTRTSILPITGLAFTDSSQHQNKFFLRGEKKSEKIW